MRLSIQHRTTYTYDRPVAFGLQQLRLTPKSRMGQSVLTWRTQVEGGTRELEFDDQHMNHVMLVSFRGEGGREAQSQGQTQAQGQSGARGQTGAQANGEGGGHRVTILSQGEVETADTSGIVGKHAGFAPLWYFHRQTPRTRAGQGVRALAKGLNADFPDEIARYHALSARILEAVEWTLGATEASSDAEEALSLGAGVCQDHAHIFVAAARLLGAPARYVSGYLMMPDRVEQEASHAWAEVHIEPIGWVGYDVSNGISPDDRYVRVATGLDYAEAAPVTGVHVGEGERLEVAIQVQQQ